MPLVNMACDYADERCDPNSMRTNKTLPFRSQLFFYEGIGEIHFQSHYSVLFGRIPWSKSTGGNWMRSCTFSLLCGIDPICMARPIVGVGFGVVDVGGGGGGGGGGGVGGVVVIVVVVVNVVACCLLLLLLLLVLLELLADWPAIFM